MSPCAPKKRIERAVLKALDTVYNGTVIKHSVSIGEQVDLSQSLQAIHQHSFPNPSKLIGHVARSGLLHLGCGLLKMLSARHCSEDDVVTHMNSIGLVFDLLLPRERDMESDYTTNGRGGEEMGEEMGEELEGQSEEESGNPYVFAAHEVVRKAADWVEQSLCRKRALEPEQDDENDSGEKAPISPCMPCESQDAHGCAYRIALHIQTDCENLAIHAAFTDLPQAQLEALACLYFSNVNCARSLSLMEDRSGTPRALSRDDRDKLQTIVEAADAQLGQETVRDVMLSFTLPAALVGVRSRLLLTREASVVATRQHPLIVQRAYEAAMATPGTLWRRGTDGTDRVESMERVCALLSGLAMLLSATADDARRGTPFQGMVQLPFLLAQPLSPLAPQLSLLWDTWVLAKMEQGGEIKLLEHGTGVDGLSRCALHLVSLVHA